MSKPRLSIFTLLSRKRSNTAPPTLSPLVRRIFLLSFMSEFIVIYPFYVIMFGERSGISAAHIGVLLASWMVVSVLAEVPTGILADKMPKKWSLVLGGALQLSTFVLWLVAPNFIGYLVGFIVWGVGEAFSSGAFQAYLYESLDGSGKKSFGKIYARTSAFTMLAYTAGGIGAFIIGPHYTTLLVASIAVSAVATGITLSLPSMRSTVEVEVRPKIVASAVRAIRGSAALRRILWMSVILLGLMGALGEYLPAYYQQVGAPTRFVALLISLGSVTAAVIYWWMHRIERQLVKYQPVIVLALTALFVLSWMGGPLIAVIGFFLFTRMLRMVTVINETQIQHHAPDESRATLGSLYAFVGKVLGAGIITLTGWCAVDNKIVVPLRWSIVLSAGIFVVLAGYFALSKKSPQEVAAS